MKVRMFAREYPNGRCVVLAQKLSQSTTLPPRECIRLAERIFAFGHREDNPAVVEIVDPNLAEELIALCTEFGISVEKEKEDAAC
jgi:hypothetical protein